MEYEKNNNNKKTAAFKLMEGSPTQEKLHLNILFFIL